MSRYQEIALTQAWERLPEGWSVIIYNGEIMYEVGDCIITPFEADLLDGTPLAIEEYCRLSEQQEGVEQ